MERPDTELEAFSRGVTPYLRDLVRSLQAQLTSPDGMHGGPLRIPAPANEAERAVLDALWRELQPPSEASSAPSGEEEQ